MATRISIRGAAALLAAPALLALVALAAPQPAADDPLRPPPNGPRRADPTFHVLRGGTVHIAPGVTVENGDVVVRQGRIVAVETDANGRRLNTEGARVWDCTGLHIYPGFIDPYVEVDAPQPDQNAPGVHWNARVTPQRSALDGTGVDDGTAEQLRKLGFAAAAIAPKGGVFRGTGAVVSLGKAEDDLSAGRPPVYRERAYHSVAFELVRGDRNDTRRWGAYPNSQMGAIALIRQTLIDAEWQRQAREAGMPIAMNALDALYSPSLREGAGGWAPAARDARPTSMPSPGARSAAPNERVIGEQPVENRLHRQEDPAGATESLADSLPLLFAADHELEALRAAKIAREFSRPAILLGSGTEFRRLEAIADEPFPVIVPLNYPRTPDVSSVGKAEAVELRDLMAWEQAPTNARRLADAGVTVALTTSRIGRDGRERGTFAANLQKAIDHGGLTGDAALAMLTVNPAEMLGVADRLGTIEPGKVASLVVADGPLFQRSPEKRPAAAGEKSPPRQRPRDPDEPSPGKGIPTTDTTTSVQPGAPEPPVAEPAPADPDEPPPPEGEPPPPDEPAEPAQPSEDPSGAAAEPGEGEKPKEEEEEDPGRAKILEVWIDGRRHEIEKGPPVALLGTWRVVEFDGKETPEGDPNAPMLVIKRDRSVTIKAGDKSARAKNVGLAVDRLDYTYDNKPFGGEGHWTDSAVVSAGVMHGTSLTPEGRVHRWKATRTEPAHRTPTVREGPGAAAPPLAGTYTITRIGDQPQEAGENLRITITDDGAVRLTGEGVDLEPGDVVVEGNTVRYVVDMAKMGGAGHVRVSASLDRDRLVGTMTVPDGTEHTWEAERVRETKKDAIPEDLGGYPFGPYAVREPPAQERLIITGATLWTASDAGVIDNGALVIDAGKIVYAGPSASMPRLAGEFTTIDAAGKHIAPGIIDCHSHTGISRGVNESGQAVTAEVRIGDVTDPDDISWYRQLAAGVTAVNQLHGSANPIGGQSQTAKVRWGVRHPDEMHFEGAKPGIKFALGENVKQSNWGSEFNTRYPQTRMGVESIIRDRFTAGQEYLGRSALRADTDRAKGIGSESRSTPRRDLELEAIAEILAGERLIHCHSYRQDEILMLCRLMDEFGVTIGTFQHNLEGYKVADAVRRSAIGASLFSDWWAYKVEVQDAIPYAGPIMHEVGVVVSYNSDSDELARRMNGEAAKAVKYGGLAPEDALNFVTLNPAVQLGIAGRVGSLEAGKDADFAVWSGPPLSTLSRCEATYVDGRRLFSLEDDAKHRERVAAERRRIIQKILAGDEGARARGGAGDAAPRVPAGRRAPRPTEDPREEYYRAARENHLLELYRLGLDPAMHRCGDCGMSEFE